MAYTIRTTPHPVNYLLALSDGCGRMEGMSERGSFVTEYIYCEKCLSVVREALLREDKEICSQSILTWENDASKDLPIVAGKVGSLGIGQEISMFEESIHKLLVGRICHDIRVAILAENGDAVIVFHPDEDPTFWHYDIGTRME